MNCYDCENLIYKPEKHFGFVTKIPHCGAGVTNRRDDPNRKNGKCMKFKQKVLGAKKDD